MTWVEPLELRRLLATGPIVITKGGTYTGSWENLTDRTPVLLREGAVPFTEILRVLGPAR